jgi:hypothetical protein
MVLVCVILPFTIGSQFLGQQSLVSNSASVVPGYCNLVTRSRWPSLATIAQSLTGAADAHRIEEIERVVR